jgi:hypothetical protein
VALLWDLLAWLWNWFAVEAVWGLLRWLWGLAEDLLALLTELAGHWRRRHQHP